MAIKIFCNACQRYIRDARPNEISELKGIEICTDCEDRIKGLWNDVEKLQKQLEQRARVMFSDAKAQLDGAVKKVIREE